MSDVIIKPNNFYNKLSNIRNLNQQIVPALFIVAFYFVIRNGLSKLLLKICILVRGSYIT